jgi:hypothetical protein
MLKKVLFGLVGVLGVFAVVVALQPADYHVERSTTIAAPAASVFAQVNDFRLWDAWSPWAKLDPNMKVTFSGAAGTVGSTYHWQGKSDVGEGRMTLTESRPGEFVGIKLEFIEPMASVCSTTFTFKPQNDQTTVTWVLDGENNFVGKAFGLFMDMDKMIGGDFEKGLAQLKAVTETGK